MAHKKQRNICIKLLQKTKNDFFNNIDVKHVTHSKQIWKTVKPCLTNKTLKDKRTTLIENENVVSDKRKLLKILMNTFQILYQT